MEECKVFVNFNEIKWESIDMNNTDNKLKAQPNEQQPILINHNYSNNHDDHYNYKDFEVAELNLLAKKEKTNLDGLEFGMSCKKQSKIKRSLKEKNISNKESNLAKSIKYAVKKPNTEKSILKK